jgi:hypothetical protein
MTPDSLGFPSQDYKGKPAALDKECGRPSRKGINNHALFPGIKRCQEPAQPVALSPGDDANLLIRLQEKVASAVSSIMRGT